MSPRSIRLCCLLGTLVTSLLVGCQGPKRGTAPKATKEESRHRLLGSWQTTSAQTSLILSIEPNQQVLVVWMYPGSHSMVRTSWKPFHGGILVQSVPRIRLWPGRGDADDELRAELEAVPEIRYDPEKAFLQRFFMRRVEYEEWPQELLDRPVPGKWKSEELDAEWNASAGERRATGVQSK